MATQYSDKLVIVNGMPAAEKLWNGRWRLEFFCDPSDGNTGWYKDNIDKWLPEFGALQDDATNNGWSYPSNSGVVYDDMRLVEAGTPFVPSASKHYVRLVYETLTSTLVAEVDDKEIEGENGLAITERTLIAKAGVAFGGTVGTSTYGGKTLIGYEVENTDAHTRVKARYSESGVVSRSTDLVGSQQALVITSLGETPATPSGYSLAKTDVNNEEGFETTSYTFLQNDSVLSRSRDYVGSQLAVVLEVFNGTPTTADANAYGGGSDYVIASEQESSVDGIPTRRFTFLENGAVLSESSRNMSEGVKEVTKVFFNTEGTTVGPVISRSTEDFDGLPTIRVSTVQDSSGNAVNNGGENLVNQYDRHVQFTYPGVVGVKVSSTSAESGDSAENRYYYQRSPVQALVKATVYVIFTDSQSVTNSDYTYDSSEGLWNPSQWAQGDHSAWQYSGSGTHIPFGDSPGFRGCRTVESGEISGVVDSISETILDDDQGLLGRLILNGSDVEISVSGGPDKPDGKKYTTDIQVAAAFEDVDGSTVYKKTIVVATIPTQGSTTLT